MRRRGATNRREAIQKEAVKEMLEEAGFEEVNVDQLPRDLHNSYYVVKKG